MARLLLLMTTQTYKAEAFLAAARWLGVHVVVGSEQPQALAALNPDGNLTLPFQSPEEATRRVLAYAATRPLDAVVAADDDGTVLAAEAARALGLLHNPVEAVRTACDKLATRSALRAAGLAVPHFARWGLHEDPHEIARRTAYPCVLKPLHLSGSRGVIRANHPEEFVGAFARLKAILHGPEVTAGPQWILVEDFIPGQEVALEGLLERGSLRTLALFDKPDPLDGPYFQETIYVTPSRHPAPVQEALVHATQRALRAIGLQHGPVHAELRFGSGIWFLEAAPRSIGGLCSRALRFGGGEVSLEGLLLRHALGLGTGDLERERCAAGVMMIPIPKPGILRGVHGLDAAREVPDVEDVRITMPRGQRVQPPPEGARYLGFIFARSTTAAAVEQALRASHAHIALDIEPEEATVPVRQVGPDGGAEARESRR